MAKEIKKAKDAVKNKAKKKEIDMTNSGNKGRRRVSFVYRGKPGEAVFLAGDFNAWDTAKKPMFDKDNNGIYTCMCLLRPGQYEYKFFVNGTWFLDSCCPNINVNQFGSHNNFIEVK
ncbi:MAG: glycoside hydrolase [Oligosphaeraceae bacterium]|nr:glycoside hydrolase [Oligosphaeraceae bacterium]